MSVADLITVISVAVTASFNKETDVWEQNHMCTAQNVFSEVMCNRALESIRNLFEKGAGIVDILSLTLHRFLLEITVKHYNVYTR